MSLCSNDTVYIVSNENIHTVDSSGAVTSRRLPDPLWGLPSGNTGGGPIPASHMPQNGVSVGPYVCFYASVPAAVYCMHTRTLAWSMLNCTTEHQGGSMVAVGNTIMVGGGFDPTTGKTNSNDVVDLFTISAL